MPSIESSNSTLALAIVAKFTVRRSKGLMMAEGDGEIDGVGLGEIPGMRLAEGVRDFVAAGR